MTALEHFGAWVASGEGAGSGVALHLADGVAAWIAGRGTAEGRMLLALPEAVMRHCACARLSEIDDIHLASATTPGGVIVPAALTLAAERGADGPALARAIAAGYEAMVRLGKAIDGPTVLYRGIWPTCFAAPFGVAAASARLLELDATRTAHALGIALALASPGARGAARWLALGHAAVNGVRAAAWAKAGFKADLGLLEGEFLSSVYGIRPRPAALTAELGVSNAVTETSFKPWCAARQTMAAVQGWTELFGAGAVPPDVREIRVSVPPPHVKMVSHGVMAGERASHLTSLPYQLALAALEPESRFDVRQNPAVISPALRAFMERVRVEPDEELLEHYPDAWPARISVVAESRTRDKLVLHVPGDPQRPWTEGDVLAKFERVVAPGTGGETARSLAGDCLAALDNAFAPAALLARIQREAR